MINKVLLIIISALILIGVFSILFYQYEISSSAGKGNQKIIPNTLVSLWANPKQTVVGIDNSFGDGKIEYCLLNVLDRLARLLAIFVEEQVQIFVMDL